MRIMIHITKKKKNQTNKKALKKVNLRHILKTLFSTTPNIVSRYNKEYIFTRMGIPIHNRSPHRNTVITLITQRMKGSNGYAKMSFWK